MTSLAGSKLDKYQVIEEVGHGGMAVVYRGSDSVLRREVAIKVLHPHLSGREESRLRLEREALAVARLRHENILEIFDYSGPDTKESYIVTEFIHGPTLREWIDDTLDPRPAVAALIVHRLCLALTHAHDGGIVHRDIKPENVMVRCTDGCLKLMDFGIAQILDSQKLTLTGQLIGSPAYMAPELISGKPLDRRTDLFSLGILLYQMATGTLPFTGRNPHEVLNRIADGDYPRPSSVCPLVDHDLEAIIACALATQPDDRYQTVRALAEELQLYLKENGVPARVEELSSYFAKPVQYVQELDVRVCEALLERAGTAARDGRSVRAISLLSRILEINAQHSQARAMLVRLRRRERRLRQALLGSGALIVTGLIAAGVMLVPPASTEPKALVLSHHQDVDRPGTAVGPSIPEVSKRPASAAIPAPTEPTGDSAGTAKVPAVVRPSVGRPVRRNPSTGKTSCTLKITGINKNEAKNFKLRVNKKLQGISERTVQVEFAGAFTVVSLDGGDKASGYVNLTPLACAKGPVELKVRRKPARLRFVGPPGLTVQCSRGCGQEQSKRWYPPKGLPAIAITGRDTVVQLKFKAAGGKYKTKTIKHRVHSGRATIEVKLDPR